MSMIREVNISQVSILCSIATDILFFFVQVVQNMPPVDVPAEDRQEFSQVLEPLFHQCNFADKNLAMIANVLQHENPVRQFIAIVS